MLSIVKTFVGVLLASAQEEKFTDKNIYFIVFWIIGQEILISTHLLIITIVIPSDSNTTTINEITRTFTAK